MAARACTGQNETINTHNSGYWQVVFSLPNAGVFFDLSKPIAINESAHAGAFLSPAAAAHSLHWINMNVAPTQSVTFTFDLQTCANCAGGWAIFQQPSLVPEAGSAVMLSAGLLALIAIVRRRNGRESMG